MPQTPLERLLAQYVFWQGDPVPKAVGSATTHQKAALLDPKNCVIIEGGNQSGKSRTTILKTVMFALEELDGCFPGQDVVIWYCTTTYEAFAGPAWTHFKNFLLFPGESVAALPTTRIQAVDWMGKAPEKPKYLCVNRPSGFKAHIHIKSYAQGRSEFQGQTLHLVVLDEECTQEIYDEVNARMFASVGAKLTVCCTPIEGEPWLDTLRDEADKAEPTTSKYRLSTLDNPAVNKEKIEAIRKMYGNLDEEVQLRLLGIPRLGSGLVYGDKVFTDEHVLEDTTYLDISTWTLNRAIDAGYRHPGCVWIAVSPDEKQMVLYRSWLGKDCTIAQAAETIKSLSGAEHYFHDLIDPAVCQTNAETGQPEIQVWKANGIHANPAPDNRVHSGIERVWKLLNERVEIPDRTGDGVLVRPRFRVVRSDCQDWLRERKLYRFKNVVKEPQRDAVDFKVVKRDDHLMDPTRYLVAAGLRYVPYVVKHYPDGDPRKVWHEMRHNHDKDKKRKR